MATGGSSGIMSLSKSVSELFSEFNPESEIGSGVMKIAPNAPKKILWEIFRWKNLYKEFQKITSI